MKIMNTKIAIILFSSLVILVLSGCSNSGTPSDTQLVGSVESETPENKPPVANAGPDQTVLAGDTVTLDGSASSDTDGTIVAYEWKEGNTVLSSDVIFTTSDFTVGTHTVTLTVTDDNTETDSDDVVITVIENKPPAPNTKVFIITVETDNPGTSSDTQFEIPTTNMNGEVYNYSIDCDNDGTNEAVGETGNYICDYPTPGTYTIVIDGYFPRVFFNNVGDKDKILSVDQWGEGTWTSMYRAFYGCTNLAINASDAPDLSIATSLRDMFASATSVNQPIGHWDTHHITDMFGMFSGATSFNQDISTWDVSNVTTMRAMFNTASAFNQDLDTWDVSNVTNMRDMFYNTATFDGNISSWNVSNVTDMTAMFNSASVFNQNISLWNLGSLTNAGGMFGSATTFNQPLNNWDVSKVTTMTGMFYRASSFDQPLDSWDVGNVTDMAGMFSYTTSFNQPLDKWIVSSVTNMQYMFYHASIFNQNINIWDISNLTSSRGLFLGATAFNQPLDNWDVSNIEDMSYMFSEAGNAPAKLIKEFRKKTKDKPLLKGAYVEESTYLGDDQLETLVNIKSKNELIGDVIALLQSPAKNVISALQSGGQSLTGILKTLSEKEG